MIRLITILTPLLFFYSAIGQNVKEIHSSRSIEYFNEKGDLIKKTLYPNSSDPQEWSFRYSKDEKGRTVTKTTSIHGTDFQKVFITYSDTLKVRESTHQLTKFGTEASVTFYEYDKNGRLFSSIEVDSLRNDTTKITQFKYLGDTTIKTQETELFTDITTTSTLDSCDFRSYISVNNKTGDTSRYEMNLYFPKNEDGWEDNLSWSKNRWTVNDVRAEEFRLFGISGYSVRISHKEIKDSMGNVTVAKTRIGSKVSTYEFRHDYY